MPAPRTTSRRRARRIGLTALAALAALLVLVNWTWGDLPGEPSHSGSDAQLGDVRVRYVEHAAAGPEVVLIHGLPGTAEDFEEVTPLLEDFRTIALDRPGYGFSDGGYHPLDEQLAALEQLLDERSIRRAVLVGHSYGGTLALAFAARRPERVRGLVLVDAAAGGARSNGFRRMQSRLVQGLSWPVVQPLADVTFSQAMRTASAKMGAAEAFDPDPVQPAYEQRLLASSMRHEDLDAYAAEQLASDDVVAGVDRRLSGIDVPAVVIQAEGDKLVAAEHGRRLAAALPDARYVPVPGGHMVPLVHPEVVAQAARACADGCDE